MNLHNQIHSELSKKNTEYIAELALQNKDIFNNLWELFIDADYETRRRSLWILEKCCKKKNSLLQPKVTIIITKLLNAEDDWHQRILLSIIKQLQLPYAMLGKLYDLCIQMIKNEKTATGIKSNAIEILAKIASKEPDLIPEIILYIEDNIAFASSGMKHRATKVIKQLYNKKGHQNDDLYLCK
ncbi:MAG: hypothetical protein C0594_02680 [Marinilabiliales bacterium]|nr:MAG: hypothetical protein C0594_02680 [Marinilabiliales bacterium]